VPFTQDLAATRVLLDETEVGMAGPRTALGDAIGLAITALDQSEAEDRVIIALTDGNDTGSRVPPIEAARIAADRDIKICVVGVGDPASVGEEALDEETLKAIASRTGGRYFHAGDRGQLEEIYTELDRIDTREVETASYRPRIDLFRWLLACSWSSARCTRPRCS
jgi:Ca-activated chloride channel family protein